MSNKFTEKQYQKIVEIGNQYHDDRMRKTEILLDYLYDDFGFKGGADTEPLDQAMAIANPLTREWAHEQFIEKEKRYVWHSKKSDDKGEKIRLHKTTTNAIKGSLSTGKERVLHDEKLTESEVKEWGYDPGKFDKEEVVVTEKKYVWTSKESDDEDQHIRLWMTDRYAVITSIVEQGEIFSKEEKLTESEIREWGYNPEMFDKEEVD